MIDIFGEVMFYELPGGSDQVQVSMHTPLVTGAVHVGGCWQWLGFRPMAQITCRLSAATTTLGHAARGSCVISYSCDTWRMLAWGAAI